MITKKYRFEKGDRAICMCKLKRKVKNKKGGHSTWEYITKARVRIISVVENRGYKQPTNPLYRVFNLDFERYEDIEDVYLKPDIGYDRELKLNKILHNDEI